MDWLQRVFGNNRPAWIIAVSVLWILNGVLATVFYYIYTDRGPEINQSILLVVEVESQLVCQALEPSIDGGTLFIPSCEVGELPSTRPLLIGRPVIVVSGEAGLDPDEDGELEWTCIGGLEMPNGNETYLLCKPVDLAGPSSDSFLLTDRETRVERIDTDGDGKADLVKVGDEESKPIVEPTPWWQTLVGPSVIAAAISGGFLLAGNRRKGEKPDKPEGQDGGEGDDKAE